MKEVNMELCNTIIQGHTLEVLKTIPDKSINMVITSPPYWGLRNYNTNPIIWDNYLDCEHEWRYITRKGITGGTKSSKVQIKGEENFQVVKDSEQAFCTKCGAWLGELGAEPTYDLYIHHLIQIFDEVKRVLTDDGSCWVNISDTYKNKSLVGIPDRLKIFMIDSGWYCRNEIIWHKPNQMPTSIKDRFTPDFEKLYFFTKNNKYYFEQQFEKSLWYEKDKRSKTGATLGDKGKEGHYALNESGKYRFDGKRNMRSVWSINTKGFKDAHFAIFPEELIRTPILACCPENGIVLDIFMGSGTTAKVAKDLNRNYLGIELNPEYIKIANERIK